MICFFSLLPPFFPIFSLNISYSVDDICLDNFSKRTIVRDMKSVTGLSMINLILLFHKRETRFKKAICSNGAKFEAKLEKLKLKIVLTFCTRNWIDLPKFWDNRDFVITEKQTYTRTRILLFRNRILSVAQENGF